MGKIIALSGPHGTGKTTAAFELAAQFKREQPGEVGLVMEIARRCPFTVLRRNRATERDAQMWIFAEQIRQDLEACRQFDRVVTDRTVVDCIAYSAVCGFHGLASAQLSLARQHIGIYKRVIFRGAAEFPYLKDDGFRSLDHALQLEVEARMLEFYAQLGVKIERSVGRLK